jgi:hypothetical protein
MAGSSTLPVVPSPVILDLELAPEDCQEKLETETEPVCRDMGAVTEVLSRISNLLRAI